jgi:putative ABC transport system permease protein
MKNLFRKLFRDIKKSFGQFIAITIISAMGIMLLTGTAVIHSSLLNMTNSYYKKSNLASLSVYYLGIDDIGINMIKEIKGVQDAYGRLSLKAESTNKKSNFIVHTVSNDEKINVPTINIGRLPRDITECIIDYSYAASNNLKTGDKVSIVMNQKTYKLTISGIFNSAEYVYLVEDPTKSAMPNHKTFGLLYVNKSLGKSLIGNNTYNEVLVTTDKKANLGIISKEIENSTNTNGFGSLILQKDQLSYSQLQSDIDTAASISKVFPYIFFLVAAVILFLSMSRTVQSERNQIGIMKALGISKGSITFHYLSYSLLCGLVGSIIGNILGVLLIPQALFSSYKMLYTFPEIKYSGFMWYIVISTVLVVLFGIFASLLSSTKALKEVPAQCLRPIPPKKVHKTWLEKREKLWNKISYKNKLIIRNILLNKRRAILSSIGVIGCIGILICAFGLKDAVNNLFDMQFNKIQKFDDIVTVSKPIPHNSIAPLNNNISSIDKLSSIPAIIALSKDVNTMLYVLSKDNKSIQLYDINNKGISLPDNGIVIPYKLAQEHHIKVGDSIFVRLEAVMYKNQAIHVKVAAITVMYLSQDLYVSYEYLQKLGIYPLVNGYYVSVKDKGLLSDTNEYLASLPDIESIVKNSSLKANITSMMGTLNTMVFIMIVMAAAMSLAVIFNISSINIFERRRDIATLKVLGYHKKEINSLVHVENYIVTVIGSVFGIVFGAVVYKAILNTIVSESMFFPYDMSLRVVTLSVFLAFIFTMFANFMLKGKTRKIDMVESLKSVE